MKIKIICLFAVLTIAARAQAHHSMGDLSSDDDPSPSAPSTALQTGSMADLESAMKDHAHSIAPTKERLQVLQGFCGADGSWRDVTPVLQKLVKDGMLLRVSWQQPYKEIGGDPASLKVKTLVISYRFDGEFQIASFEEKNPPVGLRADLP